MTTTVTVLNRGPKAVTVAGLTLAPGQFADFTVSSGNPVQIVEVANEDPGVTPNLAGGHGEDGP